MPALQKFRRLSDRGSALITQRFFRPLSNLKQAHTQIPSDSYSSAFTRCAAANACQDMGWACSRDAAVIGQIVAVVCLGCSLLEVGFKSVTIGATNHAVTIHVAQQ
jgi:hypothetical protein